MRFEADLNSPIFNDRAQKNRDARLADFVE